MRKISTYFSVALLLSACGGPPAPEAVAESELAIPIPQLDPCLLGGCEQPLPELPVVTRLFPQKARADRHIGRHVPGAPVIDYNFETCSAVEGAELTRAQRVYFDDLGTAANHYVAHRDGRSRLAPCPSGDCYLRVVLAHANEQITLDQTGVLSCESPYSGRLGSCNYLYKWAVWSRTDKTYLERERMRGFVVVADSITLRGRIDIGSRALVLIAKDRIDFDGAVIDGRWKKYDLASRQMRLWRGATDRSGDATSWNDVEFGDGDDVTYEPSVVTMIAERITGFGTLDLSGANGGAGANATRVCVDTFGRSRGTWNDCPNAPRIEIDRGHGGDGGDGGPGGRAWLIADSISGRVTGVSRGGRGGAAGRGTYGGRSGTAGRAGRSGSVIKWVNSDRRILTHAFAGQLASANLTNARHFLRYTSAQTEEGRENKRRAEALLDDTIALFCDKDANDRLGNIVTPAHRDAHEATCEEARALRSRSVAGLDWLGLRAQSYSYVAPENLRQLREEMVDELDEVAAFPRGQFWSTVREMADDNLSSAQRRADTNLALASQQLSTEEKGLALGLAVERMFRAGQSMARTGREIITNADEMARLNASIPWTYEVIRSNLRHENPDSGFFDAIGDAVGLVGGLVSGDYAGAVDSLFTIIGNIGDDSYDTSYLAAHAADVQAMSAPARALLGSDDADLEDLGAIAERVAGANDGTIAGTNRRREGDEMYELLQMAAAQRRINSSVRSALVDVYEDLDRAERANNVHDRARAVAHLHGLIELLHRIQSLADRNLELIREYVVAAGDLLVFGLEVDLAVVERDNASRREDHLRCRLGSGNSCGNVTPILRSDIRRHRIALLDASCQKARALNDNVLLLDALYYKSRDFLDLRGPNDPRTERRAAAEDYRRFLLIREDHDAFDDGGRAGLEALVDQLDRRFGREDSQINGTLCRNDAESLGMQDEDVGLCAANPASPGEAAYASATVENLLRDGHAELELSPLCGADVPEDALFCHPEVESGHRRRRVAAFDLRFVMNEGYRLPRNITWRAALRHGERHTYDFGAEDQRSFYFDPHQPAQTCNAVAELLGDEDLVCEGLDAFHDEVTYANADASRQTMPAAPRQFRAAMDSPLFGASVRGKWQLDIRPMLRAMNNANACYRRSGQGVRTSCLPALCTDADLSDDSRPGCQRLHDCADSFLGNGTLSEDAPSYCDEICGPSCQTFKAQLRAINYRVSYWH